MPTFFAQILDSRLLANPAYLEVLQQQFTMQASSGLLAVQAPAETANPLHMALLYLEGARLAALRLEPEGARALGALEIGQAWGAAEADVRMVELPPAALRAVWQAYSWWPPQPGITLPAQQFDQYLQALQQQAVAGLLHVVTAVGDGCMSLWHGSVHSAESVFAGLRGFESGMPLTRRAVEAPDEPWQVTFYPWLPDSQPGRQFAIRMAFCDLAGSLMHYYSGMVGQTLLGTANNELNRTARAHRWNIQAAGAVLLDRQFFPTLDGMAEAYRTLLAPLLRQIMQVIGAGLTRRALESGWEVLPADDRSRLEQAGLRLQDLLPR